MKIAVASDEYYPIHETLVRFLESQGHQVELFGSLVTKSDTSWVQSTQTAAREVLVGTCQEAIVACWSGTGAAIAANKIKGIRAALCWDPETAKLARIWNHANVLVLPNRILDDAKLTDILSAWFEDYDCEVGKPGVGEL